MWKVPLFKIFQDKDDIKKVADVIRRGNSWALGPEIKQFENRIAEYLGSKYCVAFNSGTSALHAALLACKIREGSKVAVPSFSFIATANCALFVGAKPVFVDIETERLGIDPDQLAKILASDKIDAIIPVHYAGGPCKIEEIMETSVRKNIIVIEDAAESFGSTANGKMTGTFGTAGVLSFAPNKVITTGEGGAVITDRREICERLLLVRSHGRMDVAGGYFSSPKPADYVQLGYNFRMPSMIAALGVSQLAKVKKIIKMRREKARYLNDKLHSIPGVQVPTEPKGCRHVYQIYSIRVPRRDALSRKLGEAGIMSKVYFAPIHLTTFYKREFGYRGGELPVTEQISGEILSLPIYPHIKRKEMDLVSKVISGYFGRS
jgi:dTDP-4-amino-4,6-dideoxygalactose transaminase